MSDEERESDLGEWCSEHREFYTEGTPCPGCKVIREAYIRGAKDFAKEVRERAVGPLDVIINDDLARAFWRTRLQLELGDWPPKEEDA